MIKRLLLIAGLLALIVFGGLQAASAAPERRTVVVVDASAGPVAIAEAQAAAKAAGAELRVPRTATEQLSVTHLFAARGYTSVVGVGLDPRVAVDPVAAEYPRTAFTAARPGGVANALADER